MIRKPTRNTYLGTFATSLFTQGCTVLQGILLARLLGPAGRGEFATVVLWPNVFAGIGILGVNMAIARFAGQGLDSGGLVKTAVKAALVTGVLSALVCSLLLPVMLPETKHNLLPSAYLFVSFIPLNHLALNLQGIDHGGGNFRWLNATRALLYPVFFTGISLCWWFATDKVFWVVVSLLVANGSVVLLRLSLKLKSFRHSGYAVTSKALIKESYPFVAASIIAILYMQMDKALLVWLLAPEEIGWYVAAFAAAGSVNVLNSALGIVQFSAAAQADPGCGFASLAKVLRRGGILSLMAGGLLAALLPWLVPLVYGADFSPAASIALLLLPGLILAGLGGIINQALCGQGHPVAGVISKVLGLVVMAWLSVALADDLGGKGIACGYLGGELVAFGGSLFIAMRFYQNATWKTLIPCKMDVKALLEIVKIKFN
jgi:O-antigen/teichoic acid export membrane protein